MATRTQEDSQTPDESNETQELNNDPAIVVGKGIGVGGFLSEIQLGGICIPTKTAWIEKVDGDPINPINGLEYWLTPGKHMISYVCSKQDCSVSTNDKGNPPAQVGSGKIKINVESGKTYKLIPYKTGVLTCSVKLE